MAEEGSPGWEGQHHQRLQEESLPTIAVCSPKESWGSNYHQRGVLDSSSAKVLPFKGKNTARRQYYPSGGLHRPLGKLQLIEKFFCLTWTMAVTPGWKQLLPARRREDEDAAGEAELAERDQVAQKPVQQRGLWDRFHNSPEERERQLWQQPLKEQQHADKQLTDQRPPVGQVHISRGVETQEKRPGPAEPEEQSAMKRVKRTEAEPGGGWKEEAGAAEFGVQSLRLAEALEWRLNLREAEEESPKLSESRQWEKGFGEAGEQSVNPVEPQEQTSGGSEMGECRLSLEEEGKGSSGESGTEQRLMQRKSRENSGLLETQMWSSEVIEAAEMRLNPGEDVEKSSRQLEAQKWSLNSGKALDWSLGRSEAPEQKPVPSDSGDDKLDLLGVEAGEGRTEASEEEAGDEGRLVSSLRSYCSVTTPLPAKKVGPRASKPQHSLLPSVSSLPLAPAPLQSTENQLRSLMFCEVKSGARVGTSHHNRHTFTVKPRCPRPPVTPVPPEPQVPDPGKKKYPTAKEIEVIGGYLHLSRSCLAKKSSERCHKHLKISFNESALETTYYYPSERSVCGLKPESTPPTPPSNQ
ncbi:phostensin-like [Dromiciops gliroides]|uniref:phostensin-like n=1 Tax=Dromiciops gliroides TaxID=33562 RepID=UPI001CC62BD6|nr:phostensin-like [Dromiciops gliroides]